MEQRSREFPDHRHTGTSLNDPETIHSEMYQSATVNVRKCLAEARV